MELPVVLGFLAAGTLLALGFSSVALALHWVRGKEHPDVTALKADILDMWDKVEHWRKRDSVRRARDSQYDTEQPQPEPAVNRKAALRARAGLNVGNRP
jgi:hypothetical protein